MKRFVVFLLLLMFSLFICVLFTFITNDMNFLVQEHIVYSLFYSWRIFPFLLATTCYIFLLIYNKKIFLTPKAFSLHLGIFLFAFIANMAWVYSHAEHIDFWDQKSFMMESNHNLREDIQIHHAYRNHEDSAIHQEDWYVTWNNLYGTYSRIKLDSNSGYKTQSEKIPLTYSSILYLKESFEFRDLGVYFSETVVSLLKDSLYPFIYNTQLLKILLFICIATLLSLQVFFIGFFPTAFQATFLYLCGSSLICIVFLTTLLQPLYVYIAALTFTVIVIALFIKNKLYWGNIGTS